MEIQETKKELNLVYDNWDDEVPLTNGNKIFPQYNLGIGKHISQTYDLNVCIESYKEIYKYADQANM
jgi:hypothetical protein